MEPRGLSFFRVLTLRTIQLVGEDVAYRRNFTHVKTHRKVMSDSRKFPGNFCPPLLQWGSSKRYNFCSIGSLLSLEKYVRQKFSFCLFSKENFDFVCFPPFLPLFFKKVGVFWKKMHLLVGNRQTQKNSKKMKCLSV